MTRTTGEFYVRHMTTQPTTGTTKGLATGTLGLWGSTVIGLASTAPVYSLVATLGLWLVATFGFRLVATNGFLLVATVGLSDVATFGFSDVATKGLREVAIAGFLLDGTFI